jgi:hypothetical protein
MGHVASADARHTRDSHLDPVPVLITECISFEAHRSVRQWSKVQIVLSWSLTPWSDAAGCEPRGALTPRPEVCTIRT